MWTHTYFWRTTALGLNEQMQNRKGQLCRVLARGRNGSILIEFQDGYRVISPRYAVRRKQMMTVEQARIIVEACEAHDSAWAELEEVNRLPETITLDAPRGTNQPFSMLESLFQDMPAIMQRMQLASEKNDNMIAAAVNLNKLLMDMNLLTAPFTHEEKLIVLREAYQGLGLEVPPHMRQ